MPPDKFRADINGLRAVAVVAVMLFHFRVPGFSGGYCGVDVFFVISGFLMTTIIVGGLANDRFSVLDFYSARVRRIIPALTAVCATLMVVGWLISTPADYASLGTHIFASLLFISNVVYYFQTSYFDAAADQKWLLHTWSLSVEGQFYLLYPLLVAAAWKFGRRNLVGLLSLIIAASFSATVLFEDAQPMAVFYLLPTRIWEMTLGGIVFLLPGLKHQRTGCVVGFALIGAGIILLDAGSERSGWLVIFPVLGTALVVSAARRFDALYNFSAIRALGASSYSIYLWHWPVLVFQTRFWGRDPLLVLTGLVVSIALGWLSYKFIEPLGKSKRLPAALGLVSASLIATGASFVISLHGIPGRFPFAMLTPEQLLEERDRYWALADKPIPFVATGPMRVMIVGDSHAIDLAYALHESGLKASFSLADTPHFCYMFGSIAGVGATNCEQHLPKILSDIARVRPDKIFLHDSWQSSDLDSLSRFLTIIRGATTAPIYVFGPKMVMNKPPSDIVALAFSEKITSAGGINQFSFQHQQTEDRTKLNDALTKMLSRTIWADQAIYYVDTIRAQCSTTLVCGIISDDGNRYLYFDFSHFTLQGAAEFGRKLRLARPDLYGPAQSAARTLGPVAR